MAKLKFMIMKSSVKNMNKLNKIFIAIICLILFSLPFIWVLVTSGYLFMKYEDKISLNFDDRDVNIGASCNNFSISYDGNGKFSA